MKGFVSLEKYVIYSILIIGLFPTFAYAYLDPGTGNIIINLLVGGLAALVFSLKSLFYRLLKNKKFKNNNDVDAEQISLFSEGKQYWLTFKPIIEGLIDNKQYFKYYTLDIEDPALLIESEFMKSKFLGYGAWSIYNYNKIESAIMLSTTPNLGTPGYPLKRPERVKKLVHVFHSINDISPYKKGSLDNYDTVIMVGDFQLKSIREIENCRNLKSKEVFSLGLPYIDELIKDKIAGKQNATKTVLVGSSWGSKGCLQSYGSGFIRDIALAGYNVIVRPHPQSLKTEEAMIRRLKNEIKDHENIVWDETISPSQSMASADILVSDTSSIRFDFAFLYEKPVITLDIKSEEMPGYERDDLKEIWTDSSSSEIGFVLQRDEIALLTEYIEKALREYDSSRITEFREKTIKNFGRAGEHIARYLSESVSEV